MLPFHIIYPILAIFTIPVLIDACYDASTFCSNSWIYSPSTCVPYLSVTLPDLYNNYCRENEKTIWKRGIRDGSTTSTEEMIDYNFIICQESFSLCGYVPLHGSKSDKCGEVMGDSGVTLGAGIDLGKQNLETFQSLGANAETLAILQDYIEKTQSNAAVAICRKPFTLEHSVVYDLSIALMDQYTSEVETKYEQEREEGTVPFTQLPKGVRTVLTSIHWKWGSYPTFWSHVISNNWQQAVQELRAWYSDGSSDRRLRSEANIIESSLGCVSNIDAVFLLDSSGSVGTDNFEIAKNWVIEFIKFFDESNNLMNTRFGVSTFSSLADYSDNIYLNEYSTITEYENKISNIIYDGGSTYLGDALINIGNNQFNENKGMRELSLGIPRLLIVLTDGISTDNVDTGVNSLLRLNLNIIAIGIAGYDINQLKDITDQDKIYGIDTFTELSTIINSVLTQSCFVPTKLNVGDKIENVAALPDQNQYFAFKISENPYENIELDIMQQEGCIYVYVSFCTQYPSYYVNDIEFTSCNQAYKQIVLSATIHECDGYGRRRLQGNGTVVLSENVYVGFEGRGIQNETSSFSMIVNKCNNTECEVGTNYDESLDTDNPYTLEDTKKEQKKTKGYGPFGKGEGNGGSINLHIYFIMCFVLCAVINVK
eukprot:198914_1